LWNQIKADVVQRPLEVSDEPEAGLKGAALLAAAGAGLIGDPAEAACARSRFGRQVLPNQENAPIYQESLIQYQRLYAHMLGYWEH
jgi:sugar (pentulose or hexulose) kinase